MDEVAENALKHRLPAERLRWEAADRYRASMDNLRFSRMPAVVIQPEDEEEIATVLELANTHRVPVTVRGAGSATTGAATPLTGGWVLDLSNWKRLHIDATSMMAYAQPGVTVSELEEAARAEGLMYPPDPGSKKYATIGGTLACNAGGLRGAKYGVTRDYVYALEGFLPSGEFVRWGANLKKFVSGYNIRDLWIGSEGTLGVITGAVLKLIPAPSTCSTFSLDFPMKQALSIASGRFSRSVWSPRCLNFSMKKPSPVSAGRGDEQLARMDTALSPRPGLLIEFDGDETEVQTHTKRLVEMFESQQLPCRTTQDPSEADALWTIRRGCSQAMYQLGPTKLNEDIVIPLEAQADLFAFLRTLRAETGLPCPTFGHAADGNFHVHIMYDHEDEADRIRAAGGIQRLMETVVDLGGAITGEHGIGLAKSTFLEVQHSPAEMRIMQELKSVFDPNNILNPDKLFTPFRPWEHPREQTRMPWDH